MKTIGKKNNKAPQAIILISFLLVSGSSLYFLYTKFRHTRTHSAVSNPTTSACTGQGQIDTPTQINTDTMEVNIQGWAFSTVPLQFVEASAGDQVLARSKVHLPRNDVITHFPDCEQTKNSGFILPLSLSQIPPQTRQIQISSVDIHANRQLLGVLPVDLSHPFASIDSPQGPIERNARNVLSGWSLSNQGFVKIRVMAQNIKIASLNTQKIREDVGKLYRLWSDSKQSGFEHLIAFHALPRGRYPLKLELTNAAGQHRQIKGPMIINDLPIARVMTDLWQMIQPTQLNLKVWAWDEDGIQSVRVETQSGQILGTLELIKTAIPYTAIIKIAAKKSQLSSLVSQPGRVYQGKIQLNTVTQALTRIQIVVTDHSGHSARYPGPLLAKPPIESQLSCSGEAFRIFIPASADILRNHRQDMSHLEDTLAKNGCIKIGIGGRIEYLRTTLGREQDFIFDPDFPDHLRIRNHQSMSTHALNQLLQHALKLQAPLQITLDGGPWADARFPAADVDVVDWLENDPSTVQWNQFGYPETDDALDNLPGAGKNPQLTRMMSLNRFNQTFLAYKKRNLQAAVRVIRQAMKHHPELDVRINLDPDEYINPWFYLSQWYDYNPNTLRQFREWITGSGPYADGAVWAAYRLPQVLNLQQMNQLAGTHWTALEEVEPPRHTPDYSDPWQQIWTQFKRHLVARHYNLLARWAAEAGMPEDKIFTSQTFIQADVAISVNDKANGWTDQAGVSIEGSKPDRGHLGVILYGPASRNEGTPRQGHSLFENIRSVDTHWGIVEYNPATIEFAEQLPSHRQAYQSISQILNSGARFISLMSGAHAADQVLMGESYHSYEALQATDYEYQLVWWLRQRQNFPLGSLLYPFGNHYVASTDGWSSDVTAQITPKLGYIILESDQPKLSLRSPALINYSLKKGATIQIKSTGAAETLSMQAFLDNGQTLPITINDTDTAIITGIIPHSQANLKQLELNWNITQPISTKRIQIDEISIRF